MPTTEPTDAQIDAHVEAADLWESGFDDDEEPEDYDGPEDGEA